ncbi:hypothetical protein Tco_0869119 [Tanacetum coccineum]
MSTQQDINAFRAQRFANTHDPLALMENTQTPCHPDHSSLITYIQHPQPNNNFVQQPSFNMNYMQQLMQNPKDISDPTTAFNMALELMAKAFTLNDTTPTNNNQRNNVGNQFRPNAMQNVKNQVVQNTVQNPGIQTVENMNGLSVVSGIANQHGNGDVVAARAEGNSNEINGNQIRCYNYRGEGHYASNCTVKPRKLDTAYLQKQMQIAQKEEAGIQLTSEEFDFMDAAGACEETERANANCTFKNNLQLASTSGTQSDKAPVYDSDGSAEVHHSENCYDNDIFNMFTQEEQYTELLEPIPEPHQAQQNDSNVMSEVSSVEQSGGIVDHHPANVEETRVYFESLYNNSATKVEKVNLVNRKMKETNAELTTELARYKNQEKCFEISQEYYDKLERSNLFETLNLLQKKLMNLLPNKALELEIKRLLRAIVSQDIMSIVQNPSVVDSSNLQTELDQCKYDKISYDKAYNDMQKKIERLQARLGDPKGKSKDTPCVSNTLDPLSQKLENENIELDFQVRNYEKENAYLKTTYKNLFDSIKVTWAQTKAIIDSLQDKLHDTIYENAKLRAQLFDKVSEQKDTNKGTSVNTQFLKQSILGNPPSSSEP